jgi:hypothetical protein
VTPEQFQQWLNGFLDAAGETLDERQTMKLREQIGRVVPGPAPFQFVPVPVPTPPPWPLPSPWIGPEVTWSPPNVCCAPNVGLPGYTGYALLGGVRNP